MKQIVVRTYDETLIGYGNDILLFPNGNSTATGALEQRLNQGYKVVMCNQVGMCLEYILQKD